MKELVGELSIGLLKVGVDCAFLLFGLQMMLDVLDGHEEGLICLCPEGILAAMLIIVAIRPWPTFRNNRGDPK